MSADDLKFDRFTVQWLYVRDLTVHPKIQRAFREWHAQEIADAFDPDLFGVLACIERGGKYLVFEGQHRLAAARLALGPDQRVPCHVHADVPLEQQARIALGQRNILAWNKIEEWGVRVIAKEEIPLKIEAVLSRHGLRVHTSAGEGVVQAVAALETIWKTYGGEPVLDRALSILGQAYGKARHTYDASLLRGLALVLYRLGDQIDDADLAAKLTRHSGPGQLVGQARDMAKAATMPMLRATADKILRVYEKGSRHAGRLTLPT